MAPLEESPRPNETLYVVYVGDGHLTGVVGGVDGRPVAHGYTDVGDGPATVLAPEQQVSCLGSTVDRGTVAHLSARCIRQGDAELLEDQHREAGAVLGLERRARSWRRQHIGGSQMLLGHGKHLAARTTHPAATTATGSRGAGCGCAGRRRCLSAVAATTPASSRVLRTGCGCAGRGTALSAFC